ncbi:MAG: hypothetical protein DRR00_31085 [Candidatus Parabeggiatoa sp. nov. 3]|nr:MAG: hypothetical protein DRR00_31085 [Gammaproteobacteria bacterium]RKZ55786.1 MAG: hypothetical protein DRQ99_29525 [Gammaproteobacteria bacterium]
MYYIKSVETCDGPITKFILRLLVIGVQNLFCCYWSAKFILLLLECKIYFAVIGVQNLFCCYWSAKFILLLLDVLFFFNVLISKAF